MYHVTLQLTLLTTHFIHLTVGPEDSLWKLQCMYYLQAAMQGGQLGPRRARMFCPGQYRTTQRHTGEKHRMCAICAEIMDRSEV